MSDNAGLIQRLRALAARINRDDPEEWVDADLLTEAADALEVMRWIPVSERLPEEGQDVLFVASVPPGAHQHLDGRVLGGRYFAGPFGGFTIPGMTTDAKCWMPSPLPPAPEPQ